MTTTDLVPYAYAGLVPAASGENSIASLMAEELQGIDFEFDRVKIPAGGGISFEMPEGSEPPSTREIVGVIVDHHRVNSLWLSKYDGSNKPPDCSSLDAETARGDRGTFFDGTIDDAGVHQCMGCPWNEFGTGVDEHGEQTGRGKRCKNMHRVYLLIRDSSFPILLTLSPTSLREFHGFLAKRIIGKGLAPTQVVVKVSLEKTKGNGVPDYSVAKWAVVGRLSDEDAKAAADYRATLQLKTRKLAVKGDDYNTAA